MNINITDRYNQTHTLSFESSTVTVAEIYHATVQASKTACIERGTVGWSVLLEAVKYFIEQSLPNLSDSFKRYASHLDSEHESFDASPLGEFVNSL
jgi:hypothetical protein